MDNMKYYNDSLAYDFNLFMPKESKNKPEDNVIKMPKERIKNAQKQNAAHKRIPVSVAWILVAAFAVAAFCGNIFLRVKITEVNKEANAVNKQIDELDAQLTGLNVEFEKIVSYTNLETVAEELGMKKMDKNQVVYIRVNNKNEAITASGERMISEE